MKDLKEFRTGEAEGYDIYDSFGQEKSKDGKTVVVFEKHGARIRIPDPVGSLKIHEDGKQVAIKKGEYTIE